MFIPSTPREMTLRCSRLCRRNTKLRWSLTFSRKYTVSIYFIRRVIYLFYSTSALLILFDESTERSDAKESTNGGFYFILFLLDDFALCRVITCITQLSKIQIYNTQRKQSQRTGFGKLLFYNLTPIDPKLWMKNKRCREMTFYHPVRTSRII